MSDKVRKYEGKEISVSFAARRCIHAEQCVKGLPAAFNRERRTWVDADAASADDIAAVVMRCPTGALHFERRDGGAAEPTPPSNEMRAQPDGPLHATGNLEIVDAEGNVILTDTRIAFCRCGHSSNKPFCADSHYPSGFKEPGAFPADPPADQELAAGEKLTITPRPNGALLLQGPVTIRDAAGGASVTRMKVSLCRCGASKRKPFCDSTHKEIGFIAE